MDRWMDGWMDGRMDGQLDGWMDLLIHLLANLASQIHHISSLTTLISSYCPWYFHIPQSTDHTIDTNVVNRRNLKGCNV